MKRYKAIFSVLFLVIIGFAVFYKPLFNSTVSSDTKSRSNYDNSSSQSRADIVFPIEVSIAHKGELIKSLRSNGILRANRKVEIISRVGGEITRVSVYNGVYVRAGDELVQLDDREYRFAYEKARNSLLGAQIDYKTFGASSAIPNVAPTTINEKMVSVKNKLSQLEDDLINKKINIDDYLRFKRDYETELAYANVNRGDVMASKSGLSQARESFERAKIDYESTTIKASFDGFVANCDLGKGMRIQAGKALFTLIDVSTLLVDIEVLETEIANVHLGRRAEIMVNAFPDQKFNGKVTAINPLVDSKSKTVKVTIELKDGRPNKWRELKLRDGMFATVNLETDILQNRLLVPKDAILTRDQRNLVFIVEGERAMWQYVEVGEENEKYVEIKKGIKAGDRVIIKGHYTLAHDVKVRIEN